MREMRMIRPWLSVALTFLIIGIFTNAWGNTLKWPEGCESYKWPKNTTMNIFLPENPGAGNGTQNDTVKLGIERWGPKLSSYMITFNFIMHAPGAGDPTDNRVVLTWPTTTTSGTEGYGAAIGGGGSIGGGEIQITPGADTTATQVFLGNLGMHEFGHVLGLWHDATEAGKAHNVMDESPDRVVEMKFTAPDCAEVESLYGAVVDGQHAIGTISGSSLVVAPGEWQYTYDVLWLSGPEIPILEIGIGIDPASVQIVSLPPGWVRFFPPLFGDGVPNPAPTASTRVLYFYADGDVAFRALNPTGTFVIQAQSPPGLGNAHAMIEGTPWTFFPVPVPTVSVIPTVSPWALAIVALLLIVLGGIFLRRISGDTMDRPRPIG